MMTYGSVVAGDEAGVCLCGRYGDHGRGGQGGRGVHQRGRPGFRGRRTRTGTRHRLTAAAFLCKCRERFGQNI